jgi:tetratricopeptide (TPR) repeat protein
MNARAVITGFGSLLVQTASAMLFLLFRLVGRDDWAERWTLNASHRFPASRVHYRIQLARYYESRGKASEAEGTLRRAVDQDPDDGYLRAILGLFLERQGRTQDAATEIEYALARRLNVSHGYMLALQEKLKSLRKRASAT